MAWSFLSLSNRSSLANHPTVVQLDADETRIRYATRVKHNECPIGGNGAAVCRNVPQIGGESVQSKCLAGLSNGKLLCQRPEVFRKREGMLRPDAGLARAMHEQWKRSNARKYQPQSEKDEQYNGACFHVVREHRLTR